MTATRQIIIEYLNKKPQASARELAHAFKATEANVRHHLRVLIQEGVVEIVSQKPTRSRGRPASLYALASQVNRNNLDGLASAMLQIMATRKNQEGRAPFLSQVAAQMAGSGGILPPNMTQRLAKAVLRLNELGYQARWEAHSEAPHVILGHCPYALILPEHPELCQMDAHLLESLLGQPARQTKKLAVDSNGKHYCQFISERGR